MTVSEMIARLQEMPQDAVVVSRSKEYHFDPVDWVSSDVAYFSEGTFWTSEHDGLTVVKVVALG